MTYPDGPPIGTTPLDNTPLEAKIGDELPTGSVELGQLLPNKPCAETTRVRWAYM